MSEMLWRDVVSRVVVCCVIQNNLGFPSFKINYESTEVVYFRAQNMTFTRAIINTIE